LDELDEEPAKMVVKRLWGMVLGMPTKLEFSVELYAAKNVERLYLTAYYPDKTRTIYTGIDVDPRTGNLVQGEQGLASTGFQVNINDAWIYSARNPALQKKLGYMQAYDDYLLKTTDLVNIDTVRLKFDYAGRDWMLQLWKGRYFFSTGGEVGLYHKEYKSNILDGTKFDLYDCPTDEENIPMSFKITANTHTAAADDDIVLVDRPVTNHWWMTAFVLRAYLYTGDKITLETEVTAKDRAMYDGLKGALDAQCAIAANQLSYTANEEALTLHIYYGAVPPTAVAAQSQKSVATDEESSVFFIDDALAAENPVDIVEIPAEVVETSAEVVDPALPAEVAEAPAQADVSSVNEQEVPAT
jgi:hypothetical protein